MAYYNAVKQFKPEMPESNGDGIQVLSHWGPHRETSISEVSTTGTTVVTATRNDTWTVSISSLADGSTIVVADATTYFTPGAIYELSAAGAMLGYSCYFNMEWTNLGGSNAPAPATGDWAWPFSNIPQFVFVAKEGQERLSLKFNLMGQSVATVFPKIADSYIQVRRLT